MIAGEQATKPLFDLAARGHRSTLLSQAVRVACKAASVLILARIVPPAEHGLFGMAASVFYVLVIFRDLGLGAAAVQSRELTPEQLTTLWWTHLLLGLALAALAVAVAPLAAGFFGEPRVLPLLATLAVGFLLLGLNAWPRVLLARELRFSELNRLEAIAAVVATLVMIAAGMMDAGAYAFAAFLLASEGMILVLAWAACRWRPEAPARWASLRDIRSLAASITGNNILIAVTNQVDVALMGRWFGSLAAGLYLRPVQLLMLPLQHIGTPLAQVLLATLSRVGTGTAEFAAHVRLTTNLAAHLTLPLAALCATLPEEVVRLLLGADWAGAAPLLRWLALGAVSSYLSATIHAVCIAGGQARALAGMAALTLALTVAGLWLGRGYGPPGMAAGVALAGLAMLPVRVSWTARCTGLRIQDFVAAFVGPSGMAVALGAGALAGRAVAGDAGWLARLGAGLGGSVLAAALLTASWPRLRVELHGVCRLRGATSPTHHAA